MALVAKAFIGDVVQAPATSTPFQMTQSRTLSRYNPFFLGLANGDTVNYIAKHLNSGQWEFGLGTWNSATLQLTRTTILDSSNAGGTVVTFDAGGIEVQSTRSATYWS